MKKKTIIGLFVLGLVLTFNITVYANFSDIGGHWAQEFVDEMVERDIISGYSDGTFKPDNTITVAEFLVVSLKMKDANLGEGSGEAWYSAYVDYAKENGVITENEIDNYDRAITREEAAKIAVKVLDRGIKINNVQFTDGEEIGSTFKGYVSKANELGLLTGYPDGSFKPSNSITRAESSVVISKMIEVDEGIVEEVVEEDIEEEDTEEVVEEDVEEDVEEGIQEVNTNNKDELSDWEKNALFGDYEWSEEERSHYLPVNIHEVVKTNIGDDFIEPEIVTYFNTFEWNGRHLGTLLANIMDYKNSGEPYELRARFITPDIANIRQMPIPGAEPRRVDGWRNMIDENDSGNIVTLPRTDGIRGGGVDFHYEVTIRKGNQEYKIIYKDTFPYKPLNPHMR